MIIKFFRRMMFFKNHLNLKKNKRKMVNYFKKRHHLKIIINFQTLYRFSLFGEKIMM